MEKELNSSGTIFDIQGFSVHDGPGCRTLVFLKGCTMQCFWCSNPEGIHPQPEPLYFQSSCIFDKNCVEACPENAITPGENKIIINRTKCLSCTDFKCVASCFTGALRTNGREVAADELLKTIRRDRQYWGQNGGITLSGGEPLLQIDFAATLLKACYDAYIHTAIETCGNVKLESYQRIADITEWIFFDLKHMDDCKHKDATGVSNKRILENARWLGEHYSGRLFFRLPLIPGFNDSHENIDATADFLAEIGLNEINLLPVHHLGREKYNMMNLPYHAAGVPVPKPDHINKIKNWFEEKNIQCYIGGDTPF